MPKVSLSVICDAANVSREGKLNITGIFTNINATTFPAAHPFMALVFVLVGDKSEAQKDMIMKIDLVAEDDSHVIPTIEGKLRFNEPAVGSKVQLSQIVQLANIKFLAPGTYEFRITLNDEVIGSAQLSVMRINLEASA